MKVSVLGALNFFVLQWFGIRLCRAQRISRRLITGIDFAGADSMGKPVWSLAWEPLEVERYFTIRWVWPLTGWWGGYRGPFQAVIIDGRSYPFRAGATPTGPLDAVAVASMVAVSGLGLALLCAGGAP